MFVDALRAARRPLVMEVKCRDAHGTDLLDGRAVGAVVRRYARAGAPCLSVVTGHWFGGTPELLTEVASHCDLPILRKDFITRRDQLRESRALGASAVLLTAALLPRTSLRTLIAAATDLGLTPFVEITGEADLARVPDPAACVIAVNNKDITTGERDPGDLDRSRALLPALRRSGTPCPVSASGIGSPDVAADLLRAGFAGLLVGTTLLRTPDLDAWLSTLDTHLAQPAPSLA
jgi:indole-3-glycerol phosphate synthase